MDAEPFFSQALVYLLAAVVAVPLAKRLGLGSVLGYLLAGVVVGPHVLGLVGRGPQGGDDVLHFAEFGVVLTLFLIGLELQPARLWQLRGPVLGLGAAQVLGTAAAVLPVAVMLGGLGWRAALAVGLILAMSSTAIVLQSLGEKGLLKTPGGEACFSVLLFQDLAVIPILALLPLLSSGSAGHGAAAEPSAAHGVGALPGWAQALAVLGAVAAVVLAGRFALRPFFRYVADTHLREIFTATALLLVVGIARLMQEVGLSAALGTFLAGVVLADSEYRHQLEADIEPFKGLLLGLFFISVGAGIDFPFVLAHPGPTAALVTGLLALKFAVLLVLGRAFGLPAAEGVLFAFALAQGGEFIFVLLAYAVGAGVLDPTTSAALVAAVALSMAATPLLLTAHDRLVRPRLLARCPGGPTRSPDAIEEREAEVILAGFGRFGHIVGRLLRASGVGVTVLENDADWVETMREFGLKTYYGDATREDLLRSAGVERAKVFVSAIDDRAQTLRLVETLRQEFPHLTIFSRAQDREHAHELIRAGLPAEKTSSGRPSAPPWTWAWPPCAPWAFRRRRPTGLPASSGSTTRAACGRWPPCPRLTRITPSTFPPPVSTSPTWRTSCGPTGRACRRETPRPPRRRRRRSQPTTRLPGSEPAALRPDRRDRRCFPTVRDRNA